MTPAAASLDSQLGFPWEAPSPAQVAAISHCCTAQAGCPREKQVKADLRLHDPRYPRANAPSGQLQTTSEHHHPAPAQLIPHGGQRLVVSGHSQSSQLIGLGKSLPLICQQQPRFNHKGKMYSAHTKGTPRVPSLGDR